MIDTSDVRFFDLLLRTGVRLHCAERGDRDGDPILFIHGWPDSWFSFSRVLLQMHRRFRCVAVDQRGFGDSDRPESTYSIAEFGDDIIAALDALAIDRAVLVGHSFGSFVARQVAILTPERVRALILIGTGFVGSNQTTREVQHALRDLPDPIPIQFARDFQSSTAYRPVPPDFFDRIVTESLKLPPRLWQRTMDSLVEHDDTQHLAQIAVPALLLWGDRDALFSRPDQESVISTLPSARLTVYEETGHCPNWERPEQIAADIVDFVSRL
jgi:non-heme chloroperoxidase